MTEELKDSGTVTALSVVGLVFGLIGMLGSFIPCIGSLAFFVGIPSAIISAIALGVAYSQKAKKTFAVVALTIGCIGVIISGFQYFTITSAGKKAVDKLDQLANTSNKRLQNQTAPIVTQQPSTGVAVKQMDSEDSDGNKDEARKLFYKAYKPLLDSDDSGKIKNDNKWIKKDILLPRGVANFVQIELTQFDIYAFRVNKLRKKIKCGEPIPEGYPDDEKYIKAGRKDGDKGYFQTYTEEEDGAHCYQFIFRPFYEDTTLSLYFPKDFQSDFKLTLKDAQLVN